MMTTLMDERCEEQSVQGEIFAFPGASNDGEELLDDPMAFKASTDPDIMYMHEAVREKDKHKFIEAMEKEVRDQMDNGNFTIVRKSEVPEGKVILPAVWQMRRKGDIKTRMVKKYKARLNIDGSRMK